jgi:branched-chain amino acid transport system substrate-binding protein
MTTRAGWISRLTVSTVLSLAAVDASAQQTIKIGEINSYKAQPAFLGPYKNGCAL